MLVKYLNLFVIVKSKSKIYLEILYAKMLEWTKEGRKASCGIEWEKHVWSKSG